MLFLGPGQSIYFITVCIYVNIVPVAGVVGTCVVLPRPEADPAKLELARRVFARHVVAATVLLDLKRNRKGDRRV